MAEGLESARIVHFTEGVAQAAQGFGGKGATSSTAGLGDVFTVFLGNLAGLGKEELDVLLQSADLELFGTFKILIGVGAVAAKAFGEAELGPVGDLVKGALMEGGIVETFGE